MGKIQYFENKEYVISSDNGKKYRILENEFLWFKENFNYKKSYYSLSDFQKNIDSFINITNMNFRYDDESFGNGIIFDFEFLLNSGESYITFSEYQTNIKEYNNQNFEVLLVNNRYGYSYQIGTILYHSVFELNSFEEYIFEPHNFILDFSKYILGMNDGKGNYENFNWE